MDRWNDHLLEEMIDNITIFYRMAPKHKLKIIKVGWWGLLEDLAGF